MPQIGIIDSETTDDQSELAGRSEIVFLNFTSDFTVALRISTSGSYIPV